MLAFDEKRVIKPLFFGGLEIEDAYVKYEFFSDSDKLCVYAVIFELEI